MPTESAEGLSIAGQPLSRTLCDSSPYTGEPELTRGSGISYSLLPDCYFTLYSISIMLGYGQSAFGVMASQVSQAVRSALIAATTSSL